MNRVKMTDLIPLMAISLVIMVFFEVIMTTLFPIVGLTYFRLPFHVLLILFLAFNIDTPYISILILLTMLVHSLFTVESWAIGTATGVFLIVILSYVRELIHLGAAITTILVTQVFMLVWNLIASVLIYFKDDNVTLILERFWNFLPASVIISLFSPILFALLSQIWNSRMGRSASGEI